MPKTYPGAVILHCPLREGAELSSFVEDCVASGVKLIAVVGIGAGAVEESIDWLLVESNEDVDLFPVTASFDEADGDPLAEAIQFLDGWPEVTTYVEVNL